MASLRSLSCLELFNCLQHQKNWPSRGPPVLFDLRAAELYEVRHIRGAHRVGVHSDGQLDAPPASWFDKIVCLYDEHGVDLELHPVCAALVADGSAREIVVLGEAYSTFESEYKFLTARASSKSAMKRPIYPSCIIPGLLFLGDLADAAALSRLREHLNISHAITALAELTPNLKASPQTPNHPRCRDLTAYGANYPLARSKRCLQRTCCQQYRTSF